MTLFNMNYQNYFKTGIQISALQPKFLFNFSLTIYGAVSQ